MRFMGYYTDPDTGKRYEVDTEAYDESPDADVVFNDDGSGRLVEPGTHENADSLRGFYVGTARTDDGDFDIDSSMIGREQPELYLEDDSKDNSEDDDDYLDED